MTTPCIVLIDKNVKAEGYLVKVGLYKILAKLVKFCNFYFFGGKHNLNQP